MERVTGIGGVFFKAQDPDALNGWYTAQLGVAPVPATYDDEPWRQEAGPTIFAAMPADADHFGGSAQRWAITFRVSDLDAMVAQLRAAGITVEVDPETYPNGRFATLHDPEGNVIQLWETRRPQ